MKSSDTCTSMVALIHATTEPWGSCMATRLAEEGWRIALCGPAAADTAAACAMVGAILCSDDLAGQGGRQSCLDTVDARLGRLDLFACELATEDAHDARPVQRHASVGQSTACRMHFDPLFPDPGDRQGDDRSATAGRRLSGAHHLRNASAFHLGSPAGTRCERRIGRSGNAHQTVGAAPCRTGRRRLSGAIRRRGRIPQTLASRSGPEAGRRGDGVGRGTSYLRDGQRFHSGLRCSQLRCSRP